MTDSRRLRRASPHVGTIDRELRALERQFDKAHDRETMRGLIKRQLVLMADRAKHIKGGPDSP
jgi:hypothetical protein